MIIEPITIKDKLGRNVLLRAAKTGDSFDDKPLISELLEGMFEELPEKKPKKAK